jgi:predicted RNase H-like HicB family nuclease
MMPCYPIAIESGDDATAFGVVFPDLPGCFSAGDSLVEAMVNAEEAAAAWIDATLDAGGVMPPASQLKFIRKRTEFAGWSFGVVSLDPARFGNSPG